MSSPPPRPPRSNPAAEEAPNSAARVHRQAVAKTEMSGTAAPPQVGKHTKKRVVVDAAHTRMPPPPPTRGQNPLARSGSTRTRSTRTLAHAHAAHAHAHTHTHTHDMQRTTHETRTTHRCLAVCVECPCVFGSACLSVCVSACLRVCRCLPCTRVWTVITAHSALSSSQLCGLWRECKFQVQVARDLHDHGAFRLIGEGMELSSTSKAAWRH